MIASVRSYAMVTKRRSKLRTSNFGWVITKSVAGHFLSRKGSSAKHECYFRLWGGHEYQELNADVISWQVACLEEFDPGVKEAAAWALGYIARHNAELAQAVVDAGAVPLLVLCIQVRALSGTYLYHQQNLLRTLVTGSNGHA